MGALEGLEEVAEQTSVRVKRSRRRGQFGWGISPSIERASAAHPQIPNPPNEKRKVDEPLAIIHVFNPVEITSYTEAIEAIRPRLGQLKIRYQDFDTLCDFPSGLTGKCLGPARPKRLGIEKFFDAMRGAGLRIRLEEDPEQTAKMRTRISENFNPRQANQARMGNSSNLSNKVIDGVLNYLTTKKGGLARLNKAVKEARSNVARRASNASWARKRELQHIGNFAALAGNVSRISSITAGRALSSSEVTTINGL
jgi:hypothetical protein